MQTDTPPLARHTARLSGPQGLLLDEAEGLLLAMRDAGYSPGQRHALMQCLVEALANAHRHGHAGDESLPISLHWTVGPLETVVRVEDQGQGFDVAAVPDPTLPENLDKEGGRGVFLIRHFAHWAFWDHGGRRVAFGVRKTQPKG